MFEDAMDDSGKKSPDERGTGLLSAVTAESGTNIARWRLTLEQRRHGYKQLLHQVGRSDVVTATTTLTTLLDFPKDNQKQNFNFSVKIDETSC